MRTNDKSPGEVRELKYYTKEWVMSTEAVGASVGFTPVPDQPIYLDEDIEKLYQAHIQQEYEDDLREFEEADRDEIEKLFQKSIEIRKTYEYEDLWPFNCVDRRLLDMGMLPQSIYDELVRIDEEATRRYEEEKEKISETLSHEKIPERIKDALIRGSQVFKAEIVKNDLIMIVRSMCRDITHTFLFKNVTVLENELDVRPGEAAFEQFVELYKKEEGYEIHFLFSIAGTVEEEIKSPLQYLTLHCSDVIDSSDDGETILFEEFYHGDRWKFGVSLNNGYYIPWLQERLAIDKEHIVYYGKAIYPLMERFAFSNQEEAESSIRSQLETLTGRDKDLLLALC